MVDAAAAADPVTGCGEPLSLENLLLIMSDNYESLNSLMEQCAVEAKAEGAEGETPRQVVARQVKKYEAQETEVANESYRRHGVERAAVEAAVRVHKQDERMLSHLTALRKEQKVRFRKCGIRINV